MSKMHGGRCALVAIGVLGGALAGSVPSAAAAPARIVYSEIEDGTRKIFSIRPDGRGVRQLTRGIAFDSGPSWSPRRRRIVFFRMNDGPSRLFTMRANGSGLRRIPNTRFAVDPAWSPNGKRIAFSMARSNGRAAIFTIRPNGRGLRRLTRYRGFSAPAWSRSGKSIAFGGARGIVTMRANGSRKRRISDSGDQPDWSPNGRRIAFVDGGGGDGRVFTIRRDGSGRRNISQNVPNDCPPDPEEPCGAHEESSPTWSPGGTRIAFTVEFNDDTNEGAIFTMRPDGSGFRRVTRSQGFEPDW